MSRRADKSFAIALKQLTGRRGGYIIFTLKINVTAMAQAHKRKGESRSLKEGRLYLLQEEICAV